MEWHAAAESAQFDLRRRVTAPGLGKTLSMADPQANARAGVPRLMIKEMVLQNFKSYAGEQRVGPFHKVGGLVQVVATRKPQQQQHLAAENVDNRFMEDV